MAMEKVMSLNFQTCFFEFCFLNFISQLALLFYLRCCLDKGAVEADLVAADRRPTELFCLFSLALCEEFFFVLYLVG